MLEHRLPVALYSYANVAEQSAQCWFPLRAHLLRQRHLVGVGGAPPADSYAGGTRLADNRKVNYVILGGDNAGEHLLM